MIVTIDAVPLVYPPRTIRTIEPGLVVYPTAGAGKVVVQPTTPGQVELIWGGDGVDPRVVDELNTARGATPFHVLEWEDETDTTTYLEVVAIPMIVYSQKAPATTVDPFTLRLEIMDVP
jgi:hypothetical protein